jgi:hypothetical protein
MIAAAAVLKVLSRADVVPGRCAVECKSGPSLIWVGRASWLYALIAPIGTFRKIIDPSAMQDALRFHPMAA